MDMFISCLVFVRTAFLGVVMTVFALTSAPS